MTPTPEERAREMREAIADIIDEMVSSPNFGADRDNAIAHRQDQLQAADAIIRALTPASADDVIEQVARARDLRDMLIVLRQHLALFCTHDDAIAKEIFDRADALIARPVDAEPIEALVLDALDWANAKLRECGKQVAFSLGMCRTLAESEKRAKDARAALAALTPASDDATVERVAEDFLTQLRRVNSERYAAWATEPVMLCEHCGADNPETDRCSPSFVRQPHSFTKPHPYLTRSNDAGIMFDAVELAGEVGELLNVVKKLEREDRGWRGSRADPADFADECADVLICLDKLARRRGVDLAAATVAKFNATSEKVGLPHRLAALGRISAGEES